MADSSMPARPAPFGRLLTAMVTPFTREGAVDYTGAQKVAAHLVDDGNDGVVVSGTTGESPTTSESEKADLIRAVVEAVGDRARVVAGVGSYDTAATIAAAQSAERAGAHGLLVVTPYYNKPPQAGLIAHFRAVADATDLDVILYDIPGRTGLAISTETLFELAEHPRIVAVKDAKGDLHASTRVLAATDLAYYCGADELNLPMLAIGAVGAISVVAHVAAAEYAAMIAAVDAGNLARAQEIDRGMVPVVRAMMMVTQGAIMAKAGLELLGVHDNRAVRLPLVEATDDEVALLHTTLAEVGLVP